MIEPLRPPSGKLRAKLFRHGRLVEAWESPNMAVVGSGLVNAQMVSGGTAAGPIAQIGFGSNAAAIAYGNTALSLDAYLKAVDGVTYPAPNQAAFAISLSTFEANGQTIAEYGLLTAGGILYARLVRAAPLIKDQSMSFTATWTLSF